jgi:hypothetical protein
MSLFKSKEERRVERNIQIRQAATQIKRQIAANTKHETDYVEKAKRARKLGWNNQYDFLKKAIKKTATIKVRLERQLLSLESAVQIKEQAEGHFEFANAMNALSKSISEVFGATDMAKTQVNFEKAMSQAENLEEKMDTFLEMTSDSMFDYEGGSEGELVSDGDIEKMLEEEVTHEEKEGVDAQIDKDLSAIQKEIDKGEKS